MFGTVPRRSFLARLAAASPVVAATLGGSALFSSVAEATPPRSGGSSPSADLDAWFHGMKGANKIIYDCVDTSSAAEGVFFARNIIKFSAEKLATKDEEMAVVVSLRHFSTAFGYNDEMWAKYPPMAEMLKVDDPASKKRASRNWLLHELVNGEAGANLPGLRAHGVSFAVCGAATAFFAKQLAGPTGDSAKIEAELSANLIPGGKMMPAGVVGIQRAQKAGFAYTYVG
jgi:intracellular sulfur oxidation DsrE/DsrF family protein